VQIADCGRSGRLHDALVMLLPQTLGTGLRRLCKKNRYKNYNSSLQHDYPLHPLLVRSARMLLPPPCHKKEKRFKIKSSTAIQAIVNFKMPSWF
jgi:hypothetical protein